MSGAIVANKTVETARAGRMAQQIAALANVAVTKVRSRLARADAAALLRDVFPELLAAPKQSRSATKSRSSPATKNRQPRRTEPKQTERTIHRVRQEFSTSCGVAVVAMFARVSHGEAMKVMFPAPTNFYGTYLKDVKRALDHFGVSYGPRWRRFRSWDEIETTALVHVKWREDRAGGGHWVIFQRRADHRWTVIDPSPPRGGTLRLSRSEMEDFDGVSYLPVAARPPRQPRSSSTKTGATRAQ